MMKIRNIHITKKSKKDVLIAVVIYLIFTSFFAIPSYGSSGLPTWEFKGAYANYTYNYSAYSLDKSSNFSKWNNITGYEMSKISSLENGNYSCYFVQYPSIIPPYSILVLKTTMPENSSFIVMQNTSYNQLEPYLGTMPAVNSSILRDLISNTTVLFFAGGPLNIPIKISQTLYDYNGTEMKTIKGYVRLTATNSSGYREALYETVYLSASSGLVLGYTSIESIRSPDNERITEFLNYSMGLRSTNIQVENIFWTATSTLLTALIALIVVAGVSVSVLVVRRRKAIKRYQ
jgi:hypothetical protein